LQCALGVLVHPWDCSRGAWCKLIPRHLRRLGREERKTDWSASRQATWIPSTLRGSMFQATSTGLVERQRCLRLSDSARRVVTQRWHMGTMVLNTFDLSRHQYFLVLTPPGIRFSRTISFPWENGYELKLANCAHDVLYSHSPIIWWKIGDRGVLIVSGPISHVTLICLHLVKLVDGLLAARIPHDRPELETRDRLTWVTPWQGTVEVT
jgi:hypothetical protein